MRFLVRLFFVAVPASVSALVFSLAVVDIRGGIVAGLLVVLLGWSATKSRPERGEL